MSFDLTGIRTFTIQFEHNGNTLQANSKNLKIGLKNLNNLNFQRIEKFLNKYIIAHRKGNWKLLEKKDNRAIFNYHLQDQEAEEILEKFQKHPFQNLAWKGTKDILYINDNTSLTTIQKIRVALLMVFEIGNIFSYLSDTTIIGPFLAQYDMLERSSLKHMNIVIPTTSVQATLVYTYFTMQGYEFEVDYARFAGVHVKVVHLKKKDLSIDVIFMEDFNLEAARQAWGFNIFEYSLNKDGLLKPQALVDTPRDERVITAHEICINGKR